MTFLSQPASDSFDHNSYLLLATSVIIELIAWRGLSLSGKTIKSESDLCTRQMKFQKWCIEQWPTPTVSVSTFLSG